MKLILAALAFCATQTLNCANGSKGVVIGFETPISGGTICIRDTQPGFTTPETIMAHAQSCKDCQKCVQNIKNIHPNIFLDVWLCPIVSKPQDPTKATHSKKILAALASEK